MDKPLHKYAVIEVTEFKFSNPMYSLKETFPALIQATKYKESLETIAQLEGKDDRNSYIIYEISVNNPPKVDLK